MNERIKELGRQAGLYMEDQHPGGFPNEELAVAEKFAELIVAECINIVNPTQHHEVWAQSYLGGVDGLDLLYSKVKEIKKHFGVEQ
jgi:hypothetical protein